MWVILTTGISSTSQGFWTWWHGLMKDMVLPPSSRPFPPLFFCCPVAWGNDRQGPLPTWSLGSTCNTKKKPKNWPRSQLNSWKRNIPQKNSHTLPKMMVWKRWNSSKTMAIFGIYTSWWFGARWFGFWLDPRKWKGLLLFGCIPIRIPKPRAPNHQLTISWSEQWKKKTTLSLTQPCNGPWTKNLNCVCNTKYVQYYAIPKSLKVS